MFFQISPVAHKKSQPAKKKINEDDEVEVLSLAPFTPNPKLVFSDVKIGTVKSRKLLIKNPTNENVELFVKKSVPEDLNLVLSWTETCIKPSQNEILELVWCPHSEVASRHSFTLSDGKRINRVVPITFHCLSPKVAKGRAKSKPQDPSQPTRIAKSPVKLQLVKKTSPIKKYSSKTVSPRAYSSPTSFYRKSKKTPPQKYSPSPRMKQKDLADRSNIPQIMIDSPKSSRTSRAKGKENTFAHLASNHDSDVFISPSSATFTLEKFQTDERRETYTVQNLERRETFTSQTVRRTETFGRPQQQDLSVLSDSLEMSSPESPGLAAFINKRINSKKEQPKPLAMDFDHKLRMMDSFAFSPLPTASKEHSFFSNKCSTARKPLSNTTTPENSKNVTELFKEYQNSFNISPTANISTETYVKGNLSSETYTKDTAGFDTYAKSNLSSGTYVKDSSVGNVSNLDVSPTSFVFSEPRAYQLPSSSFRENTVVSPVQLSCIREESYYHRSGSENESDSSVRMGLKRKSDLTFKISPPKKAMVTKPKKDWSKTGKIASRVAKSTSGLNLKQFIKKYDTKQPVISTITHEETKTVVVQNPFLFANIVDPFMASHIYCNEEWVEQQEANFKKWLNALLTPPADLDTDIECVDVAKLWQECKKREVDIAPTKEVVSNNYHTSKKLDSLRIHARALFESEEMIQVVLKVSMAVDSGKLVIREDKDIHLNLGLKSTILSLILSYNPLWLRIGLETIYKETIPLRSNSDISGLMHFVLERMFKDPYLLRKYKTVYAPKYTVDLKKFFLKKFLILVYFLDQAKNKKIISHDPCLFCKNAPVKESRDILVNFAKETLSAVGDITRFLKSSCYLVTHRQTYIHEFDYAVKNLGGDLRDGVRLAKVMEIIQMRSGLTDTLRVPAVSRLQKIHNMKVVFNSLEEAGYRILYDISPKDIVDGHKEKTLSFLWQIIYKFEAPLMVKSATTIQTWFRSLPVTLKRRNIQRIRQQREEAARKIQSWYRHQQLSQKLFALREFVDKFIHERKMERAALKIQSFWKMCICRKRYLVQHKTVVCIQAYSRGYLIRNNYHKRLLAAVIIQNNFRMYLARKQYLRMKYAAVKIQTWYRSMLEMRSCQNYYRSLKKSVMTVEERYLANKKMKMERHKYIQIKEATLTIQRRYRAQVDMKKCRKEFTYLKTAAIVLQQRYRASKLAKQQKLAYDALKSSAKYIQIRFRANQSMKIERNQYLVIKRATVKIQTWFRATVEMKQRRTYFVSLKFAVSILEERYSAKKLMQKESKNYKKLKNAALIIQRRYTALVQMRKDRKEYLNLKSTVIFMQRKFRANNLAKIERRNYLKLKESVILVQRQYRAQKSMQVARNSFKVLKMTTIMIQQRFRANLRMKKARANYEQILKATNTIQQHYRAQKLMLRERNNYQNLKKASLLIQQRYRAKKLAQQEKENYHRIRKAVVTIQRRYRAIKSMQVLRKEYIVMKTATVLVQRRFRANILMKNCQREYHKIQQAVKVIQVRYRAQTLMLKQRNEYLLLKTAVITIQTRFRANKLAKIEQQRFSTLKKYVLLVQRQFKAQKLMRVVRNEYIQLRASTIGIQQRFRANLLMKETRAHYQKILQATITIQNHYRAQKLMLIGRGDYQKLKNAVLVIQTKYRANKLAKQETQNYQHLRKLVVTVQQKYRAKKSMQVVRNQYLELRKITITIQRRFRANMLMKQARKEYLAIQEAVQVIQHRYHAQKLMLEQRNYYISLKSAVVSVQTRFRANKLAQRERSKYLQLKDAVLKMQRRYRARKTMEKEVISYTRLKWAVLVIQRRYQAKKTMQREMRKYARLKQATFVIQRRLKAVLMMRAQRKRFLQFKESIRTIQAFYRSYVQMKNERELFLVKRTVVVNLQRHIRGYLTRQKYAKYLTPEAIEAKRQLKIQNAAAVKIQAIWRGYHTRSSNIPEIQRFRQRKVKTNVVDTSISTKTLGQRCEIAMQCLINENSSLLQIIKALEDLDFITRHCRTSCMRMSDLLPDHLYLLLSSTARSLPEMNACNVASFILINFCKYPPTRSNSWVPDYIDQLIKVMLHWCDKEAPLFSTLCTLIWLFAHTEGWKQFILGLPNIKSTMTKIQSMVKRKANMVANTRSKVKTYFGRCVNLNMPSYTANWGLDYDRPNTFTNSVHALESLLKILELQ